MRRLRSQHPNFWLVVVGDVAALTWLGLVYLLVPTRGDSFRVVTALVPLKVSALGFLAAAALIGGGLWRSWKVFRAGLAVGAFMASVFALSFLLALVDDVAGGREANAPGSPATLGFLAWCLIAQSREPRTNPDAQQ